MTQDSSDEPESVKYQRAQDEQYFRGVLEHLEEIRIDLATMIYRQTGALPDGLRRPRDRRPRRVKNGENVVHIAHLFRRTDR